MTELWEGYRNCKPGEVPKDVQFCESERVGKVLVSFGDVGGCKQRWGAPWRCIAHVETGKVQFSRFVLTPRGKERPDE